MQTTVTLFQLRKPSNDIWAKDLYTLSHPGKDLYTLSHPGKDLYTLHIEQ
jgi:hypothetical protein